jgi:exodeoxyribonuclease VII large subunit
LRSAARALPSGDAILAGPRQRLDQAGLAIRSRAREGFDARRLALERLWRRLARHSPRAQAAAARERHRAFAQRLARAGEGLTRRFRDALTHAANARDREVRRDGQRRVDRLAAAAGRWNASLLAERRRARERATGPTTLEARLRRAFRDAAARARARLTSAAQILAAVGYKSVLARGFALVRDENGAPVRRAADIVAPAALRVEFADGEIAVTTGGKSPAAKPPRRKRVAEDQTTLF